MGLQDGNCPVPDGVEDLSIKGSAHKAMTIVALVASATTFVISVALIVQHLRRYRLPKEQRQIIRIAFAPVVFAAISFCQVLDYKIAQYIDPIGDLYEAFSLCALFLLYTQFAVPNSTFNEEMFEAVKAQEEGKDLNFDWPRLTWIFTFQYPVVEIICIIIIEATTATNTYCANSLSPKFGHIWATILQSISVGAAVLSVYRYYGHMKNRLSARRAIAKLVAFKVIVGVRFFQTWIFSILIEHNVVKTSSTFSYGDLLWGIPNVLTCVETVLFSLGFWYAYSSSEYSSTARPTARRMSVPKAILHSLNPYDLFAGIGRAVGLALHLQRTGGFKDWSEAKKQTKMDKKQAKLEKKYGVQQPQRYQTVDGMESMPQPAQSHRRYESENNSYAMNNVEGLYQPPSNNSPPTYDASNSYLMADARRTRSPSPGGYGGYRQYDRSSSPSGRMPLQGRDMV